MYLQFFFKIGQQYINSHILLSPSKMSLTFVDVSSATSTLHIYLLWSMNVSQFIDIGIVRAPHTFPLPSMQVLYESWDLPWAGKFIRQVAGSKIYQLLWIRS